MSIPYASAFTGANARDEITKALRRFGCESVGFMDDFDNHEVLLAFTHRGRPVHLRASAKGWAQMYLRQEPWTYPSLRLESGLRTGGAPPGARRPQQHFAGLDKRSNDGGGKWHPLLRSRLYARTC